MCSIDYFKVHDQIKVIVELNIPFKNCESMRFAIAMRWREVGTFNKSLEFRGPKLFQTGLPPKITMTSLSHSLIPGLLELLYPCESSFCSVSIFRNFEHVCTLQHAYPTDMPTFEELGFQNWVAFVVCTAKNHLVKSRPVAVHCLRQEADHSAADLVGNNAGQQKRVMLRWANGKWILR